MREFVLLNGSNLNNRLSNLKNAMAELSKLADITVIRASAVYESAAVEMNLDSPDSPESAESTNPPDFLNQALLISTSLTPLDLLRLTQKVETKLGRQPEDKGKRLPRTIDIDILLCGSEIVSEEDLQIPHPRLNVRAFALAPLLELLPDMTDPHGGQPYRDCFTTEFQNQVWKTKSTYSSSKS